MSRGVKVKSSNVVASQSTAPWWLSSALHGYAIAQPRSVEWWKSTAKRRDVTAWYCSAMLRNGRVRFSAAGSGNGLVKTVE